MEREHTAFLTGPSTKENSKTIISLAIVLFISIMEIPIMERSLRANLQEPVNICLNSIVYHTVVIGKVGYKMGGADMSIRHS